jgi:protein-disulfide isomerase
MSSPWLVRFRLFAALLTFLAVLAAGCAGSRPSSAPLGEGAPPPPADSSGPVSDGTVGNAPVVQPSSSRLPVEADGPVKGPALAPVTLMAFMDLECPFCARVMPTLKQVESKYEGKLRVVYRHYPLPFHEHAVDAALAAESVRDQGGTDAYFAFIERVYDRGGAEISVMMLRETAASVGVPLEADFRTPARKARVERDIELAKAIGVNGTPSFRINGIEIGGAQPVTRFIEVIDAELVAAERARDKGVAREAIYAERVATNLTVTTASPKAEPPPDNKVWQVPVDGSPVLGKADALVTIVEFSEFQCPFCKRAQPTLDRVREKYGDDVRIVFKHNPLPFHPRAVPAARLSLEVRKRKGDAAFFQVVDKLFASAPKLQDADLVLVGTEMGLDEKRINAVLGGTNDAYARTLETDMDLAFDLSARGTPHFFVNGRRLAGAQPFEKFVELIDEQLAIAKGVVEAGTPRSKVYAKLMATAEPPAKPEMREMPPVTADTPILGNPNGKITWHVFSDLECPFCARFYPTLLEVVRGNPDVRVAWHNLPLPFHVSAPAAANAALEVRRQQGDAGFWKFVEAVYADKSRDDLSKKVQRAASAVGANVDQVDAAVQEKRFERVIERDIDQSNQSAISGTPASIIGGYFVSGAQPKRAFEKALKLAREDLKKGMKPAERR